MRRRRLVTGTAVAVAVVVGVAAVLVVRGMPGGPGVPEPPGGGPLTVVSVGDSTLAGEGAGDYVAGTDGTGGNWCHRSPHALAHRLDLSGVEEVVNLACSGASSQDVALGGTEQWTEPPQARQLADLARTHRVAVVVVAVGANDDPGFSRLMSDCLNARITLSTPCSESIGQDWAQRLRDMVPKVARAVEDVKSALAGAGYEPTDYRLVQLSYASPLPPDIPEELRNLSACPFRTEDLRWIHDHAVSTLSAALRESAERTGARFLDMSRAGEGHEACTGGDDPSGEWFTRLTVDWDSFGDAERAEHASVASFHPNAEGHGQYARCVEEFLRTDDRRAACLVGEDGDLHAATP